MGAMVVALGFAVLFQFVILRIKWNKGLYADVFVDAGMLLLLNVVFGGSIQGVVSATAGATFISLYLLWKPIKILEDTPEKAKDDETELDKSLRKMQEHIDSLINK